MADEKRLFGERKGERKRLETLSARGRDARLRQEVRGYRGLPAELRLCKERTIRRERAKGLKLTPSWGSTLPHCGAENKPGLRPTGDASLMSSSREPRLLFIAPLDKLLMCKRSREMREMEEEQDRAGQAARRSSRSRTCSIRS